MANGVTVLPPFDKFAGLRGGLQNFLGGQLQQQQQQQAAQQLGQLFPGQNFQGITNPLAQQVLIRRALQQQQAGQQAPFTLGPGQQRFGPTGQPIAQVPAKPIVPKQSSSVILDPADPSKAIRVRNTFDAQGNIVNQVKIGDATLAEAIGGVAPEIFTQLQKPVASKIQTELKDVEVNIANLESILEQFKPEFTELPFKIGVGVTAFREKIGGFLGKPTDQQKKDLADLTAWRRDAAREFVVFKKWATGVAAGQKEMSEQIEQAFATPLKDSATQFRSKMESAIRVRKRTRGILTDILNSGTVLSVRDKRNAEQNSLRQALNEEIGRQALSQTQQQPIDFTPKQIEAELRRRGAIQ